MKNVIYPGTFDPITNGHLDLIQRSAVIFSKVSVAVANNPSKKTLLSFEQRVVLVQQSVAHLSNVDVFGFDDLLADVVKTRRFAAIIRGVRTTMDFEYELQLATLNRFLTAGVETFMLPPSEKWAFTSSTAVREIYLHGGDVSFFVPPPVFDALMALKR